MLDQPAPIRRRVNRYRGRGRQPPDALMQDDPPNSYYVLLLAIDDAVGRNPGDGQLHMMFDAGYVKWYRQLGNPLTPPALNVVALQSGASLLELIQTPAQYDALNQELRKTVSRQLIESSWWMVTPTYNFRRSVHFEQFLPPPLGQDPSQVGHPNSRQSDLFVLPRLFVPRNPMRQLLFSLREQL